MKIQKALPKVIIDARMIDKIPHGIARYVTYLAKGLAQLRKAENGLRYEPIFLVNSSNPDLFSFQTIEMKSPFLSPKELIEIPKTLKRLGAALYHSPSFSSLWNCP